MALSSKPDNDSAVRSVKDSENPSSTSNTSNNKPFSLFDNPTSKAYRSTFRGIFTILFGFIAFSTLIRYLVNPDLPTLSVQWLISVLQGTPQLSFDWLVTSSINLGDWSFNIGSWNVNFNELRDAIYYIYSAMIQPIIIILQAIVQIVGFIGYFLGQIFLLQ